MLFEIGDEVIIKDRLIKGTIEHCKHEKFTTKNGTVDKTTYAIYTGKYYREWATEDEIMLIDEYNIDFEIGFLGLLVDVCLKEKDINEAKRLHNEKLELLKKKKKG